VLVGRLAKVGSGWLGQWQLLDPQGNVSWQSKAGSAERAAEAGLQEAADRIAERYAPIALASGGDQTLVLVRGVHSLSALKTVEQLFTSLDAVQTTALTRVEADRIWLRLGLAGTPDSVSRGAALGGQLRAVPVGQQIPATAPGPDASAPVPDLIFDLNP
jgi:hypothetical protein